MPLKIRHFKTALVTELAIVELQNPFVHLKYAPSSASQSVLDTVLLASILGRYCAHFIPITWHIFLESLPLCDVYDRTLLIQLETSRFPSISPSVENITEAFIRIVKILPFIWRRSSENSNLAVQKIFTENLTIMTCLDRSAPHYLHHNPGAVIH